MCLYVLFFAYQVDNQMLPKKKVLLLKVLQGRSAELYTSFVSSFVIDLQRTELNDREIQPVYPTLSQK